MLPMRDDDVPELDQPDADRVYRNYLVTCRRLGVKPYRGIAHKA
jgi:hypothetical protein